MQTADPKRTFIERFITSVEAGHFIRLTLSKYRGSEPLQRIVVTQVQLKKKVALAFDYTYERKAERKNFDGAKAATHLSELLGASFMAATLFTKDADVLLQFSKKMVATVRMAPASLTPRPLAVHNREKEYLVRADIKFLYYLGISNADGKVKAERFDKFRQINKFIEIVDVLCKQSNILGKRSLSLVDFGSGKNYLTFALYDYFTNQKDIACTITGIEARPDLVAHGNEVAARCGFSRLTFQQGHIGKVPLPDTDIVVALHACDTATDDAIVQAIRANARIIALAPCCQKYVRPRMNLGAALSAIFHHGILEERFAESLTNGLRASVLEAYGYSSKVFEFISGDHTAKNVMITATRGDMPPRLLPDQQHQLAELRAAFGLSDFYLDTALGM